MQPGLTEFIRAMPKVELHVHFEGAVQPQTLLRLARKNGIQLPADTVDGIRQWYAFTDFPHFVEIYLQISDCIRTPDDIELLAREFLQGQAAQNIRYSEVTYTPSTHYKQKGLAFGDQLAAINRARDWAEAELGVSMALITDIDRSNSTLETAMMVADWAVSGHGNGVVALGLGGYEPGYPAGKFAPAFQRAHEAGMPCVLHAGETGGADSIWDALQTGQSVRIGHGVRCLEDPALVTELRDRQIPLEVSPTSNVCLGVFDSLETHALPRLLSEGLYVTLNSDDPPMFNTTLTDEYLKSAQTFGWDVGQVEQLVLNALRASFLPRSVKANMEREFYADFARLRREYLVTP
ncbi:MAG: adenosine deaminase [Anaerolineaceae bacterium]|nr:adenosine deaminase [Anaerolineaceae bacterium]